LDNLIENMTEFLGPAASGVLGNALIGLAILIIGLFVVKIISGIVGRLLGAVGFLADNQLDTPIASLVKALLTIFVLMAVLRHFDLVDVLAPLEDMMTQFLGVIPNIIGAGIIGYVGWILAKLVSELVGMALGKVDQQIAARTGNDDVKISKFVGALVFGAILLPIVVAALGVLNIPAISVPASSMINDLMAAVPNIIGAAIILLVTYFVTKFVVLILGGLLESMQVNSLPEKMGAQGMFSESFTPVKFIGGAIMFFSMLTGATAAVNALGIEVISTIFAKALEFGGGIFVGGVILLIGNFLSSIAHQRLSAGTSQGMANIARFAILGLVLAMGLKAMGLADNIVNLAFGLTMGGVAVAAAIAFGLGGRDAAKAVADKWAGRIG
jgi:hypothetical protein